MEGINPTLWIVVLYMAVMIGIALFVSFRKVKSSEDFHLAARSLGPLMMAGTLAAAEIGGGSTIGVAQKAFSSWGLSAGWYVVCAGIGIFLVSFVAPFLRRSMATTVPEIIERRYGKPSHLITTILSLFTLFVATAAQVKATSAIIGTISGGDLVTVTIMVTIVVIFVTDVKTDANQDAIGKSLAELGEMRGKDPLEATYDLLYQESNAVGMVDFYGLEEHVKAFMNRPEMNVCTDGLLGGKPHPRVYGAFPRVLGKYVREEKAMDVETAVRKMTGRPAEVFGLKNRGLLKPGMAADVTVFDPRTIIDKGTYTDPRQYPDGILHVFVNGRAAVKNGALQKDVLAGKVLRK